jgi:hypothetical protein
MNNRYQNMLASCVIFLFIVPFNALGADSVHVWQVQEITLNMEKDCSDNCFKDVTCWVDLKGPNFSKRIYGFWDGAGRFVVRLVATEPGQWQWTSGSNRPDDKGLNGQSGKFNAVKWSEKEKLQNPNRRGFIRPSANGHALQYADGTPFFMVGDTWLAASTWRLPFRGAEPAKNYVPGPGIGFEDAVACRKAQGFNSVSMIACFPNWEADCNPATYADSTGLFLRNAWEKFGCPAANGQDTAKNMRDEYGNLPFKMSAQHPGVADFDHITPEYFQSLDKKIKYLSEQGFVPLIETVRRDACPSWKAYYDFNDSYARYAQYLISRYGAYNIVFSGIHLDWIPKEYSLSADEFNQALTYHLKKYGPLPFGQPFTTLISDSTYKQFGHDQNCPWLTMHSVGNKPRDHSVSPAIETLFNLHPACPAINFEPYYTGWNHQINMPDGERPPAGSPRDNYFSRAQMYGSVLSGALSGHVHGTSAYDITTTGEPAGARHHFWDAMKFESAKYMRHLAAFVLSEGDKYRQLQPCPQNIQPQKAPGSPARGLDGWSFMLLTPEKDLALLYFENKAVLPTLTGFKPGSFYSFRWFNPRDGRWQRSVTIKADENGKLATPAFPDGQKTSDTDWAAKIIQRR